MRTQHFPTAARTANEASATGHSVDDWVVFSKQDSSFDAKMKDISMNESILFCFGVLLYILKSDNKHGDIRPEELEESN